MTTLSETPAQAPRSTHLRAYLAGTGATGALVAGAVIVFLSLATFVAFNGIPFGGSGGNSGNSYLGVRGGGTPAAAATALAAAPGAVASAPVAGAPVGAGGPSAVASNVGSGPGGTLTAGGGSTSGGGAGTGTVPGDGTTPPGSDPGGQPCTTCDPAPTSSTGVVGNTIDQVDGTAGTDLSGGPVGGVAGTVDKTVTDTGNTVGGAVGKPGLGDNLNNTVNGTVDKVVGGGLPGLSK